MTKNALSQRLADTLISKSVVCHDDNTYTRTEHYRFGTDTLHTLTEERVTKCPNKHEWSNQFGDDWTPDVGMLCDCGSIQWGVLPPIDMVALRGGTGTTLSQPAGAFLGGAAFGPTGKLAEEPKSYVTCCCYGSLAVHQTESSRCPIHQEKIAQPEMPVPADRERLIAYLEDARRSSIEGSMYARVELGFLREAIAALRQPAEADDLLVKEQILHQATRDSLDGCTKRVSELARQLSIARYERDKALREGGWTSPSETDILRVWDSTTDGIGHSLPPTARAKFGLALHALYHREPKPVDGPEEHAG